MKLEVLRQKQATRTTCRWSGRDFGYSVFAANQGCGQNKIGALHSMCANKVVFKSHTSNHSWKLLPNGCSSTCCQQLRIPGRSWPSRASFFAVHGILEQGWTPGIASDLSACNQHNSSGELAGEIVQEVVRLESAIEEVTRQLDNHFVGMTGFQVSDKEGVSAGDGHVVLQSLQDGLLHVKNL